MQSYTEPTRWETSLRALLTRLNYHATARDEVVAWVATHGDTEGCPSVEGDAPALDALLERHWSEEAPADEWPGWTDSYRYEPTPEEEEWFLTELDRADALEGMRAAETELSRVDAWFDRKALESRSIDNLGRGLIPPDLAGMIARTSVVGHQP